MFCARARVSCPRVLKMASKACKADIQEQIKAQGEVVRQLKKEQAPQDKVCPRDAPTH